LNTWLKDPEIILTSYHGILNFFAKKGNQIDKKKGNRFAAPSDLLLDYISMKERGFTKSI